MAHSYARRRSLAVLAAPLALAITLAYLLRRGVYESDDRDGMVIVARWRPVRETVLVAGFVLAGYAVLGAVAGLVGLLDALLGAVVLLLGSVLSGTGAVLMAQEQQTVSPVGPGTPTSGDRWQVAALAQRPGTCLSALLLTRRVVTAVVPPGDVLVAAAGSARLERAYVRAGFTAVGRGRLYRIR